MIGNKQDEVESGMSLDLIADTWIKIEEDLRRDFLSKHPKP